MPTGEPATRPTGRTGRERVPAPGRWSGLADATARRAAQVPPRVWLAGVLALAAAAWAVLQVVWPYHGHDEAVYADRARSWVSGGPATGWAIYRPPVLPALASLALRVSDSTAAVRLLGLVLVLASLALVHAVTARVTTPARAVIGLLVLLGGPSFVRRVPEFLDDIPSAALLLLVAHLVARSRRPGQAWALPAAGAVAGLTVLLRYGAVAGVLAVAVAAVAVWGPRTWLRSWRAVLLTAAVLAVFLAPVVAYGYRRTGHPLGVFTAAQDVAAGGAPGTALLDYARAFPVELAGVLGALLMVAGVAGAAQSLLAVRHGDPGDEHRARERGFLAITALLSLLLLGLGAHAEPRYLFFTVAALVVLGVDAVARAARTRSGPALVALAALGLGALAVDTTVVARRLHQAALPRDSLASAAGQAVRGPGRCVIVVRRLVVEAAWVSGCEGTDPRHLPLIGAALDDVTIDVVEFPGAAGWQAVAAVRQSMPARRWTVTPLGDTGALGQAVLAVSPPVRP